MEKTGESYTAARAMLLTADEAKPTDGPMLPVSEGVIRERTGRGWEEWFDLLDGWDAPKRPRRDVVAQLGEEYGVTGWDAQAVTLTYQRARGLRAVGEHEDGFRVTASKTVAVPVETLFDAFVDESRRREWLPDGELTERTATRPKSARFDWGDGRTRVFVDFESKGNGKSTSALRHERLPDAAAADRMKSYWRDRVAALKEVLER